MTKRFDLSYFGDLKYPSDPEMRFTQTKVKPQLDENNNPVFVNSEPKCSSANIQYDCLRNHHGTHMDMPSHKNQGGKTIDDYLLDKFVNPCMMIDLSETDVLRRREISKSDLEEAINRAYLTNPSLGALIFYTGYGDLIEHNNRELHGQAKTDFESKFPYFSQEAADYVVEKFPKLNVIGIDSWSVDKQGSKSEIHKTFFAKDTLILETLLGLKQLISYKEQIFTLHSQPIKIPEGDAAWVRAYAEIP